MKNKKKAAKTSKKKQKKKGVTKPKPKMKPSTTPEKPQKGGAIDQPRPSTLPKTPPRVPKTNKGGRPKGSLDKQPRKPKTPTAPAPELEVKEEVKETPPQLSGLAGQAGEGTPPLPPVVNTKCLSAAKLATRITGAVCSNSLPPSLRAEETAMIQEAWYDYLVDSGGEIPSWLGLAFANAAVLLPRFQAAKARKASERAD